MPAAAIGGIFMLGGMIAGAIMYSNAQRSAQNAANSARRETAAIYGSVDEDGNYSPGEMMKLANKQYERWEQDFGEIQTEVADYYKNLSDDILKQQYEDANTQANQSLVQQYFAAQSNIKSSMNKAGMAGSGAEQSSTLQLQQTALAQKAQNRWQTQQLKANANNVLMGQKANWVQQGENLRSQAMQNQFNSLAATGQDASARYLLHQQAAYTAEQNMINTISSGLMNMGGMGLGLEAGMAKAGMEFDWSNFKYVKSDKLNAQQQVTPVSTPSSSSQTFGSIPLQNQYFAGQMNSGSNVNFAASLGLDPYNSTTTATTRRYK